MNRPGPYGASFRATALLAVVALCAAPEAHASFLSGEALDTAANVIAWLALLVVPVVLIAVFWMVHILPEKIAHKRHHPQLDAIKTLCLLSLLFGGLLWPLAWLWAYTRPVLHKLAYGTDTVDHGDGDAALAPLHDARIDEPDPLQPAPVDETVWRQRVAALEQRLATLEGARPRPQRQGEE
ncbi:DUF3302 domain-containing protein [Stenotrophomonas sp. PD6]|uniref:DUF3302 domain-containing protein n=1 Tax=Stenotrophomonas sp. PD6 TaxID=3368612 RepID=UPI003BA068B4